MMQNINKTDTYMCNVCKHLFEVTEGEVKPKRCIYNHKEQKIVDFHGGGYSILVGR